MTTTALATISQARRALAEAKTISETVEIRDRAKAFLSYVDTRKTSIPERNDWADVVIQAERQGGAMLAETVSPGRPKLFQAGIIKLGDLGISLTQSHRWQMMARLDQSEYDTFVARCNKEERELTSAAVYSLAKNGIYFSSDTPEWHTPPEIIDRVLRVLGEIDLDPCAPKGKKQPVPAKQHLTILDDGLSRDWTGRVYMNPPYGNVIADWVRKLVDEYDAANVTAAIALVPARTDTQWFQLLRPYWRCFVTGRLTFSGHDNAAPFPSMVVYLGERKRRFVEAFSDTGDTYELVEVAA